VCYEVFYWKEFFKNGLEPTSDQIRYLAKQIAEINKLKFKPKGVYDVWAMQNLMLEYKKKSMFLKGKNKKLVKYVLPKLKNINFKNCKKGFLHTDLQRSNILINKHGQINIIDFSVMEYNAIVIELAVFISLFCINPNIVCPQKAKEIIDLVINEYQKYNRIPQTDLAFLPVLIYGTYAINCLAASFEKYGKYNNDSETQYWIDLGKGGMQLFKKLL